MTKIDPLINEVFKCARCPVFIKPGDGRTKIGVYTYCELCALDIATAPEKQNDVRRTEKN